MAKMMRWLMRLKKVMGVLKVQKDDQGGMDDGMTDKLECAKDEGGGDKEQGDE